MDDLTLFNADHRILITCTKSARVLLEMQKSTKLKPRDVAYNGQVILTSSYIKFLGITFDSVSPLNLTFVTSPLLHVIVS